jgi:serine/threonine protein kinase
MDELTEPTLPSVATPPLIGRVLASRYEIFDHVGSGDMANVFRAWDRQVHHLVAVKMLDQRFAANPEMGQTFEREARFAASLPTHRNIVPIYTVGRNGDLPYIVMQIVPGRNLKELIDSEAPIEVARAFALCLQIARGLEFAHQYGLVHRNLKPQNVLVAPNDEVKLADFGLGCAGETADTESTCGLVARSRYLSPEQALGKPAEPRSDIYSLGVILFEMLTGTLPFHADNPLALAMKHAREQVPDPSRLNPALSSATAAIVLRALAKEPGERYRSAAAFASAIHQHLLLEKGDTPRYFRGTETGQRMEQRTIRPIERPQKSTPQPKKRPRLRVSRTRRLSLMSLLFLLTFAIAGAGGWFTYGAISRAVNGSNPTAGVGHDSKGEQQAAAQRKAKGANKGASRRTANQGQKRNVSAPAPGSCAANRVGPVRLVKIWAERVVTNPGGAVTFDYTLANDSRECRHVLLGLTAFSSLQAGNPLTDRAGARVVGAEPGVHMYKRLFTFPGTAAGQRFDVLLSVSDPSGAQTYGSIRVPGLITVTPR